MAATKRNARFYVYVIGPLDAPLYVGKGSGRRLEAQKRRFKADGHEIARFFKEKDAYAFERVAIAENSPALNQNMGGGGSRATPVRQEREPKGYDRQWSARFLDLNWEKLRPFMSVEAASWSNLHRIRDAAYAG